MIRLLCISVRFLTGRYHGAEWPPSPARLFQALVAGAKAGCRTAEWSDASEKALRWLEQRPPPEIIAPVAWKARSYDLFVPDNVMDVVAKDWAKNQEPRKQPEDLRTKKTVRPRIIEEPDKKEAAVHYLWRIGEAEWPEAESHVGVLCQMARYLLALGWGVDQAAGYGQILAEADVSHLIGKRYLPREGVTHRVPKRGFFDAVMQAYGRFYSSDRDLFDPQDRPDSKLGQPIHYSTELEHRHWVAFALRDEGGGVPVRWQDGMVVAAWLRHAAGKRMELEGKSREWIDSYVLGHGNGDGRSQRLSYVPLPSIGHQHVDGRVRRVLVSEPFGGDGRISELLEWGLSGATLTDEAGSIRARLASPEPDDSVLRRYTTESAIWMTVTPVILHGRDHLRGKFVSKKAEKLILQALTESGYDAGLIDEFWYQGAPLWRGTGHARQCRVPAHLSQWPRYHIGVRFKTPVQGPVLAGIGRHYGLGVFAAL